MTIKVFAGPHREILILRGDAILFRGTLRADWSRYVHAYFSQEHNERPSLFIDEVFLAHRGEVPIILSDSMTQLELPRDLNHFPWEVLFESGVPLGRRLGESSGTPAPESITAEQTRLVVCKHPALTEYFKPYPHYNALRESMKIGYRGAVLCDVATSRERFLEILRDDPCSVLVVAAHCDHRKGVMFEEGDPMSPQWLRENLDASATAMPRVVLMNCCGWDTPDFPQLFLSRGARLVIAAFAPIMIRGMAHFAEALFRGLTESRDRHQALTVGHVLAQTNLACFGRGVYLAAYGNPQIQLDPVISAEQALGGKPRRIVIVHQNRVVETIEIEETGEVTDAAGPYAVDNASV